jgi:AraC-like DNA-binding protein
MPYEGETRMWTHISRDALRHVIRQLAPTEIPSDDDLRRLAAGLRVPQNAVFHFSAQVRALGEISVTLSTQSALQLLGEHVDTQGLVYIGFLMSGTMRLGMKGRRGDTFGPSAAYAVPNWHDFELETTDMTRGLMVRIPEYRLRDRGIHVRADRFDSSAMGSLGAPLRAFAAATTNIAWKPSEAGLIVAERTFEDLLVGMFLETEGYAMDAADLRAGLRARAISQISAGHREPGLNPTAVALRLNVSLRHLQRAFEESTMTITGEINRCRTDSAALLLSAPGAEALTVTDIAERSGFRSAFELRSSFKSRFGMLPSEYRHLRIGTSVARHDLVNPAPMQNIGQLQTA